MVLGRCAPSGTCVVDQNIHMAQSLHTCRTKALDVMFIGAIGGDELRINAGFFQHRNGLF